MGTKYNDEAPSGVLHNALAFGTTVKGDVTTDGDFRLDGRIEGTISCGGKIVIGPTAQVEGDIISVNAEILGTVVGSITTSEVLVLKPTAVIKGIITTQALVVEPSAKFSGTCNMTLEDSETNTMQHLDLPVENKAPVIESYTIGNELNDEE
ncbi:cytoskeletal protein CcmA (bactofilin family) [Parabacteroides sp. PF5-5]|uniref:bactofilin family protein n=1 Tax=unclassified Parabacteroides TaxID=2649774 RepID=UPI00247575C9|nr:MULTISPECIES: polymer-forming cytoskeletal protein [unclassified Parabacteroides]MDH6306535.1 cytoskeletal protein CcmA (bactofilin family) [Parabacteroides sp. PH5-39]MDH6317502.1 cytoskeletal protein CcmA (bactofilin family) [Parabacteroides sp. PF5-13]MDH6321195.1 cytoskeletal protein CcmA (bactofilin family) [Parabacteroides sp. PH5-13]MDH6324927.1 cytoskeletal protein CcmA (bactofilin family) [Parabacteroides sp. PH5-8]MDH6328636.1 cytoskeletal protein CcmA (bactofilin family) [Parabac